MDGILLKFADKLEGMAFSGLWWLYFSIMLTLIIIIFCGTGVWTQGLHLETLHLFFFFFLVMGFFLR
jgi:hypothetical protein